MEILINDQKFNIDNANTFYKKLIGLMGQHNIKIGLLLKTSSIHTIFMKEPIDIIMLDKNKRIIYYQKNVKKNKIIIKKKAQYTIELPHNSLKEININDQVIFL